MRAQLADRIRAERPANRPGFIVGVVIGFAVIAGIIAAAGWLLWLPLAWLVR